MANTNTTTKGRLFRHVVGGTEAEAKSVFYPNVVRSVNPGVGWRLGGKGIALNYGDMVLVVEDKVKLYTSYGSIGTVLLAGEEVFYASQDEFVLYFVEVPPTGRLR